MSFIAIEGLGHILQALLATIFTWAMTAVGAAGVFFFKSVNKRVLNAMLGFAAGVMIAASFWSLLAPTIEMAEAFLYGQASGLVEPVAGVLGAAAVLLVRPLLPYALAFAAGAMIYVVVEELIPEAQQAEDTHAATVGAMLGFALMMLLDVALG